ncbi:unknown [Clostridium sp. CAG:242]|nr:unknown [Clostridium sp. CAG:242]
MKKVLSVAMASAMVLGMGANVFAITYNSGSNNTASWPKGFAFEGSLFVTDKNGDIVEQATTDINSNKAVDFEPGDVIWMPLYAEDQKVYTVDGAVENGQDEVAATTITLNVAEEGQAKVGEVEVDKNGTVLPFSYTDELNKVVYYYNTVKPDNKDGWRYVELKSGDFTTYANGRQASGADLYEKVEAHTVKEEVSKSIKYSCGSITGEDIIDVYFMAGEHTLSTTGKLDSDKVMVSLESDHVIELLKSSDNDSKATYFADKQTFTLNHQHEGGSVTITGSKETVVPEGTELKDVTIKVRLPKVAGVDENAGTIKPGYTNKVNVTETVVSHGHYTGNIDKNWSINLIEKSTGVAELIEKAELYKATAVDYTSYHKYTDEIAPNAVYLKITLEDEWKTTSSETLKYYVYVANNKSNTQKTNEVWVSGKYENTDVREVSFDWTNDASKAGLWKVKEGNGI